MIKLISECNDFMKDCGFTYAFCGGYALELFLGKKLRPHSDIDVTVFDDNKADVIEYVLSKGWNVYEHGFDWIDSKKSNSYLKSILSPEDKRISSLHSVWALKPNCSFIKLEPKHNQKNIYDYAITDNEQLNFDYIGIEFNKREDEKFVLDSFSSQGKTLQENSTKQSFLLMKKYRI